MVIKKFPKIDNLYFGPAPITKEDFDQLKELKLALIYNLAREKFNIISEEEKICEVIFEDIPDYSIPNEVYLKMGLSYVKDKLVNNENVYIHCNAGKGRTGLVAGCYLKCFEHMRSDRAISLVKKYCDGPETQEQIDFIRKFKLGGSNIVELTKEDVIRKGEILCQRHLNCSFDEGVNKVKSGELDGTAIKCEIKGLLFLLE